MKIKLSEALRLIEEKTGKKVVLKESSQSKEAISHYLRRSNEGLLKYVVNIFGRQYGEGLKYAETIEANLLDAIRQRVGIEKGKFKE